MQCIPSLVWVFQNVCTAFFGKRPRKRGVPSTVFHAFDIGLA